MKTKVSVSSSSQFQCKATNVHFYKLCYKLPTDSPTPTGDERWCSPFTRTPMPLPWCVLMRGMRLMQGMNGMWLSVNAVRVVDLWMAQGVSGLFAHIRQI